MKIVNDDNPLTAEAITFIKEFGITIEGWNSEENGNTEVAIDCDVNPRSDLFKCECTVEFKYLAFHFPTSLEKENQDYSIYSLIKGDKASLSISNCRFVRPEAEYLNVNYGLVNTFGGSLTMDLVECANNNYAFRFEKEMLCAYGPQTVILSNSTFMKIETSKVPIITISSEGKCDTELNGCMFFKCKVDTRGTLYLDSLNEESTFSIGDEALTTFSSCYCSDYHGSGGIYLIIRNMESANQLNWPEDGRNLRFENCTAGEGELNRNIGIYLEMENDSFFEEIAFAMKNSFAINYTIAEHMWYITGYDSLNSEEIDFVSKFFDQLLPPPQKFSRIYAKSGGTGNGESLENPIGVLNESNINLEQNTECFIEIIATNSSVLGEEAMFNSSYGITIEGVSSDGSSNAEAIINCNAGPPSALFTCVGEVEFKYLVFNISSEFERDALIKSIERSTLLTVSNCRFVGVGSQSSKGSDLCRYGAEYITGRLVRVSDGKASMNNVSFTIHADCASLYPSPFHFEGVSEVSLNGVNVSNVKIMNNATFLFEDSEDKATKIIVEGMNAQNVITTFGEAARFAMYLRSEESTVSIGRQSRCTFKSCLSTGKAGAIYIRMEKIKPNLQLPSAGNLDIDSSNKVGTMPKPASLFIESEGIDEFCKQENVFQFADAFEGSTAGWIMGRKNDQSNYEDLYEKYLKWKEEGPKGDDPKEDDPKEDDPKDKEDKGGNGGNEGNGEEEKPFAWWIIVIVVGVVAVVAVACVILIVMKKKRSSKNRINVEDEENESEGKGGKGGRNKKRTKRGGELEEGRPAKNFVVDADSDGSSRKTDDSDDGDNTTGTLEAEHETEEEDRTKKNAEKEADSKGNENASVRQHLDNVKQNINETFEQFEQKEQKEKNGSALITKAVSHVLSSTSSSSSFSSVLNEGLQTKELAANIKGLIAETNVMSPLSE
ncbi:uncharacterized protein MONOS_6162 [Monocercomonoides exilis]|uniref:uncharacterized protein n=1 Tax=Monocercomonoides exilis TaxID=2049356 RepID=UPI003559D21E|nr:hypothetical protein MONOS_6162 [Monocercomonoides exilis]|eukprot:MONOS_6162.1-p1 / transcript=MONOS_6162.1 / gene=MONOS_6162 / organism=Monocercomonoides_exilis_PA203 / gene_product=unspecified product / transcript_product=unspecified product / location=Mono_scaffold00190:62343-65177(-) / protein_length=945 / sequence_SO=supercontig / SO=protein_coding / is_pseudo=false